MFNNEFYEYLNNNTLMGIKCGTDRARFTDIWMVNVGNRVFARSWNKSTKSWFTEFINTKKGQIKFGNETVNVIGIKLDKYDPIQFKIDQAYLNKYDQPYNIEYAKGISQPEYSDYTMEFIVNLFDI